MTDEDAFVLEIVGRLDAAGIPYMLTGSVASSNYGVRRQTADADFLIDPPDAGSVIRFVSRLGERFYADRNTALTAVRDRRMFNVIDVEQAFKADCIVRKDAEYDRQSFTRRRLRPLGPGLPEAWMVAPEDSILSKLRWAAETGSTRQVDDAKSVAAVQGDALDRPYLFRWADELGVRPALDAVLAAADAIAP